MTSSIRRALPARSCSAVTAPSLGGDRLASEDLFRMEVRRVQRSPRSQTARRSSAMRNTTTNASSTSRQNASTTMLNSAPRINTTTPPPGLALKAMTEYPSQNSVTTTVIRTYRTLMILTVTNEVKLKSNSAAKNPRASAACADDIAELMPCPRPGEAIGCPPGGWDPETPGGGTPNPASPCPGALRP